MLQGGWCLRLPGFSSGCCWTKFHLIFVINFVVKFGVGIMIFIVWLIWACALLNLGEHRLSRFVWVAEVEHHTVLHKQVWNTLYLFSIVNRGSWVAFNCSLVHPNLSWRKPWVCTWMRSNEDAKVCTWMRSNDNAEVLYLNENSGQVIFLQMVFMKEKVLKYSRKLLYKQIVY